jgi:hypothetical protein
MARMIPVPGGDRFFPAATACSWNDRLFPYEPFGNRDALLAPRAAAAPCGPPGPGRPGPRWRRRGRVDALRKVQRVPRERPRAATGSRRGPRARPRPPARPDGLQAETGARVPALPSSGAAPGGAAASQAHALRPAARAPAAGGRAGPARVHALWPGRTWLREALVPDVPDERGLPVFMSRKVPSLWTR